ncbi:MAG: efflux RND transporter periplasmic adaptor subunit [Prevotellaceae bacterium]|jgi:multidrug efflux pump subunit AcrA (membrane-fusion protein)|nr:efflux RND transporter periplasmic adaptor subunit [Prevotellaceae bacterium]
MKRKIYIIAGIIALIAIVAIYVLTGTKDTVDQKVKVQKGLFEIVVSTTGELQALNMENIEAPEELRGRNIRMGDVKIMDLIPEGTVVDSGDYVGALDRSSLDNTMKTTETELEQTRAQYENALVDTSLNLRQMRDNIQNLLFTLEESKITMEQSIFEPPATQRKAKNDYERALRNYEQELQRYALRQEQELGKIKDIQIRLVRKEDEYKDMLQLLSKFTIYAPKPGMVIYLKEWGGAKRKVGSTVSPWDRTIATLPDLSIMVSKTYVNEVDISKVKIGQIVRLGVDAFPDRKYTGMVTDVANVGEQLKNSDAKVFEVLVRMNQSDSILRPSMTTSNEIVIATIQDVIYLPLEALHADSVPFVYRANGTKQVIIPGEMNDNFRIIEQGLEVGDEVYLSTPENPEKFELTGFDLITIIKEREAKRREEALKQEQERERMNTRRRGSGTGGFNMPQQGMMPGMGNRGGGGGGGAGGGRRR